MTNKIPLVSVLVTPYNQKDYLRQTLDSILMQQCDFEFEILIGEDCSTDGTREICQEYAAQHADRIVLCLNERNKGLLNNYFDIFLKARGKYIADCGGDDYWLTTIKLQEQVDILENHPEVSLVTGNWQLYEQKTGTLSNTASWIEADWFEPDLFGRQAVENYLNTTKIPRVSLAASCFRADWAKATYEAHPEIFRGKNVVCEDLPLTLGLLIQGPFYVSKSNWLVYRVLEKSLSHSESRHSYMKGFAFSAYRQTLDLALTLGVEVQSLSSYIYRRAGDFALHAFLYDDAELLDELIALLKSHGLKLRPKHQLLRSCMRMPVLAKSLRGLYTKKNLQP